jgi:hypothetical protein
MLQEKSLAEPLSFTFYTYSQAGIPLEERWARTGIPDIFFGDCEEAPRAVIALRDDVTADPEMEWPTMILEKIEIVPLTRSNVLALLNTGPGTFIASYDIIETIGPKA